MSALRKVTWQQGNGSVAKVFTLEQSVRHTMWADHKLFSALAELPHEAWACHYGNPQWTIRHLAAHIISGAEWYRYVLAGTHWGDDPTLESREDFLQARDRLQVVNEQLLEIVIQQVDEPVSFTDENGEATFQRSTVASQIAYHSTEHRTQIACALEMNGYGDAVRLDFYDLWAFENESRG
jgi:uncharacterized damage-inducible protein DinB